MGPGVRSATLMIAESPGLFPESPAGFSRPPAQAVNAKMLMWRLVDKNARIWFIVLSSEYRVSGCRLWRFRSELPQRRRSEPLYGVRPDCHDTELKVALKCRENPE